VTVVIFTGYRNKCQAIGIAQLPAVCNDVRNLGVRSASQPAIYDFRYFRRFEFQSGIS
jgi:hypothetical protein